MHHPNKRGLRNQSAISKVHWRGVRSFARYELKGNPKEMNTPEMRWLSLTKPLKSRSANVESINGL